MTQNSNLAGHWLIVSDLDGTLLDHYDYSHRAVDALLQQLEQQQIPVALNSSKTCAEMLEIRRALNNSHPFIVENGSAIYIPKGYFAQKPSAARDWQDFWLLEPGTPREQLLDYLHTDAVQHGAPYLSFSGANSEEIVRATGLSEAQAVAAQQRSYSEPLLWQGSEEEKREFIRRASHAGLNTLQGGRFLHLLGQTDKGSATLSLLTLYRQYHHADFRLIAAGDSPNDLDMLEVADIAVVIRAPEQAPPTVGETATRRVLVSSAIGPEGWRETIGQLFT